MAMTTEVGLTRTVRVPSRLAPQSALPTRAQRPDIDAAPLFDGSECALMVHSTPA